MIDDGFKSGSAGGIDRAFLLLFGVALLLALGTAARFFFVSLLGERVVADLRTKLYGHLIGLEEWMSSPISEGSAVELRSGMAMQMDVIPGHPTYGSTRMEDGYAIADAALGGSTESTASPEARPPPTHLVRFLQRFCEDRAFAWRHVRLPQRIWWSGGEVVLRRRNTTTYNEFFFCDGFEYHSPNIVSSSRTAWSVTSETSWGTPGNHDAIMRFEWLDSRWQLVRCNFCGYFEGP